MANPAGVTGSLLMTMMQEHGSNQTEEPFIPPQFEVTSKSMINLTIGSLLSIATFTGQMIVFVVVSKDYRLRDAGSYYITALAIADLLISLTIMPMWTLYTTMGYWPLPQYVCDFWNCLDFCLCATSINVIFFISIDRYLSLKYPFEYPLKRTDFISKLALVLIWIGTFVTYAAYIGITQYLFAPEVRYIYDCSAYFLESVPATFILMIIVLWAPIFGTMIVYILIFRIAAKVAAAQKAQTIGTKAGENKDGKDAKSGEDELKAVKTIGLLLITFVVCWFPITFGYCSNALWPGSVNPWFLIICYWMGYTNSMINPICYALGNPFFKQTLKKLFSR